MTARQKRLLRILIVGVPLLAVSLAEARKLWRFERDGTWPEDTDGPR
jgi:hypothetical protein